MELVKENTRTWKYRKELFDEFLDLSLRLNDLARIVQNPISGLSELDTIHWCNDSEELKARLDRLIFETSTFLAVELLVKPKGNEDGDSDSE